MEDKGVEYAVVYRKRQIGSLWFDVVDQIQLKDCNCVVVSMVKGEEKEDVRKTYYVLVIRKLCKRYERVGVGKVEV